MTNNLRILCALLASLTLHAALIAWASVIASKRIDHGGTRVHQPLATHIRVAAQAARNLGPDGDGSPTHEAEPPSDTRKAKYISQTHLTRPTELLTPLDLAEIFPNGVAPAQPVVVTILVSQDGTVDDVIVPNTGELWDPDAVRRVLKNWIFLPGEIHGSRVPSVVEIEFAPLSSPDNS